MQTAAFRTCAPRVGAFNGSRVVVAPQRAQLLAPSMSRRGTVQVVAAEEQKKKRTPQPVKRAQLALERRSRNRSRKSAIATRTKKVAKVAETAAKALALDEQQVSQLEKLVSEAFQEIDKAVSKGTLHANTGSRRKARVSLLKRQALIAAGLYAPKPEQPGYFFFQRMEGRRSSAAAAAQRAAAAAN